MKPKQLLKDRSFTIRIANNGFLIEQYLTDTEDYAVSQFVFESMEGLTSFLLDTYNEYVPGKDIPDNKVLRQNLEYIHDLAQGVGNRCLVMTNDTIRLNMNLIQKAACKLYPDEQG